MFSFFQKWFLFGILLFHAQYWEMAHTLNILHFEHRKIFKMRLAIFEPCEWKG